MKGELKMSGELEIFVYVADAVEKYIRSRIEGVRARREALKNARQSYLDSLKSLESNVGLLKEQNKENRDLMESMEDKTNEIEKMLENLDEESKTELANFKNSHLEILTSLVERLNELGIKEDKKIRESINKIKHTNDRVDIINIFAETRVELESMIDDRIREEEESLKLLNDFGINSEEDIQDEEKVALFSMYQQLEEMGYNPIFDLNSKKILVEKDNGDQIVAFNNNDKIKLEFHDYEGRDCVNDIVKIERRLKDKSLIDEDTVIYTDWYRTEEKEKNKEKVLSNREIIERYKAENNTQTNISANERTVSK